jgi:hypothetical protein
LWERVRISRVGAKIKSGSVRYLQRKRNTYYARVRAPQDLCSGANNEIWRSLETSDRREALERLPAAVAAIRGELEQRRAALGRYRGVSAPKPVTVEEFEKIAALWVRSCLITDEQDRAEGLNDKEYDALTEQLSKGEEEFGRAIARGDAKTIDPALPNLLHTLGWSPPTTPKNSAASATGSSSPRSSSFNSVTRHDRLPGA